MRSTLWCHSFESLHLFEEYHQNHWFQECCNLFHLLHSSWALLNRCIFTHNASIIPLFRIYICKILSEHFADMWLTAPLRDPKYWFTAPPTYFKYCPLFHPETLNIGIQNLLFYFIYDMILFSLGITFWLRFKKCEHMSFSFFY